MSLNNSSNYSIDITGITTGTLNATNATVTNVSAGVINSTGLTTGNINFTGSLFQNGVAYLGSQWTTTSGNVSYTSGSVVATNVVGNSISAGTLSATTITGANLSLSGNLSVAGTLTTVNITSTNMLNTNISAGTLIATTSVTSGLLSATNIVGNSISAGTLSATTITGGNLSLSGNLSVAGTLTTVNITSTNMLNTNISAGTINATGLTSLQNVTLTNVSTATLSASTGITVSSAQITNANITTSTIATLRVSSNLLALGNSNTIGNIFTTGGNVGINTTSPGSSLHVAGTIPISPVGAGVHMGIDSSGYAAMQFNSTLGGYLDFGVPGGDYTSRIFANAAGNLGINTISPSELLTVNGNIRLGPTTDSDADYYIKCAGQLTISANDASSQNTNFTSLALTAGVSPNQSIINLAGSSVSKSISFLTSNTERMRIDASGNVGIGTNLQSFTTVHSLTVMKNGVNISGISGALDINPYGQLQVCMNDTDLASRTHLAFVRSGLMTSDFTLNTSNQLVIKVSGAGGVYLPSGGTGWSAVSDRTMKTDFQDITTPLDKLVQVKGLYYRYLTDNPDIKRVGLIAQDVRNVLPEAVSENADGILGLSYTDLIPLVIEACKELKINNDNLQSEVNTLKAFIQSKFPGEL